MKINSRRIRYSFLMIAASLLLTAALSLGIFAASPRILVNTLTSLTLINQAEDEYIENASFRLYCVASMNEDGEFMPEAEFDESGVMLDTDISDDDWFARAVTLESYVVERAADGDPIEPTASGITDANGQIKFTNLPVGLYLLTGDKLEEGNKAYTPLASIISLPYPEGKEARNYTPVVYVKNSIEVYSDEPNYTELSVVKVWKDEGYESSRPTEVTVTLYCDGEEYETVTLNSDNNWKYTWYGLDESSRWQLSERDVPENYTVTSVQEGDVFTVTNTYKSETPGTSETPDPTLPQTGQLWWPITILSIGGLALLLVGFGIRRRSKAHHEAK